VLYREYVNCRFHLTGEDHPLLQIEFIDKVLSALGNPTKRVFFTFREGVEWDDAQLLVDELNKKIQHMAVTEYAPGEG
jgi:coenzyme F420-reducing hydrogenase delta subunit